MRSKSRFRRLLPMIVPALCAGLLSGPSVAAKTPPPLPIEEIGRVEQLPASYPEDWILIDEASFFFMSAGKVIILDVGEKEQPKRIKGMMQKSNLGNFTQSAKRGEYYIIESFHERGSRGKKYDILAFYDKQALKIQKEIEWPTDRLQSLPEKYSMGVSADEKFLYVANFNPAASFSVVDLDTREIVETIGTPGCVLTYPTGKRSVTSICSNGGFLTTVLDKNGKLKSRHRIDPFFDTDKTPIFERPVFVDGIAYFPSFTGEMHMVDMSGEVAEYKGKWSMVTDEQKAANWRPGGLGLVDRDDQGRYYVIMHPDGHEGSQTHGGPQVWVYDLKKKERVKVIEAPNWAVSIGVTRGKNPKLVVTNGEMNLDIFNTEDGSLIQTVSDFGNVTPLILHKSY